ncbi:hypothetical protein J2T12_001028 [Paenibacillus anaericanus]|nr:hypothetical protein [Paenibacillus anaericanus]
MNPNNAHTIMTNKAARFQPHVVQVIHLFYIKVDRK